MGKTNKSSVDLLILTAIKKGVAKSALKSFLSYGYVPQEKQLEFHAAARLCDDKNKPNEIGFGGARGGSKTFSTFAQVALDDCQRYPGLKVLFLRKVSKAANEAIEDLRYQLLQSCPHEFKTQKSTIIFPNGSKIIVGHFQNEKDIDNYLGLEYDIIVIEEATQLSFSKIEKIKTCNRSGKVYNGEIFRPRMYYTTNPGGVGHSWFKKKFVEPYRAGTENDTKFIPSTVYDNKKINPEYIKTLESLTGWLREAWLDGSWDVFAGQFFSNWNYDRIVKPISTPLPGQTVWCAMDYGFTHPTVVYLFSEYDGKVQVIDEFRAIKQLPSQNAEEIHAMLARHGLTVDSLDAFVAGRDVFANRGDENARTIADQYASHGIILTAAIDDRVNGWAELLKLFGDDKREPQIEISPLCKYLIQCIPSLQHNPKRPEDVLKTNVNDDGENGDDEGDTLRYGVMAKSQIFGGSFEVGVSMQ